jgi:hypothetical protein
MTKSIQINGLMMDLSDDATEADVTRLTEFVQRLEAQQAQRRKDFDRIWQQHGGPTIERGIAWKWFEIGCELAEHRATKAAR